MIYLRLLALGMFCAFILMIAFSVTSAAAADATSQASGPSSPQRVFDPAGGLGQTGRSKTIFQYDSLKPIEAKEIKTETRDGVVITDIEYPSFKDQHGRIKAYLVKPTGLGTFAGVLFFHWLGETKADRTEFLDDAIELARLGTVSVLFDGFFPWKEAPQDGSKDLQQVVDQTIEVRRALDLLLAQPDVDPKRVGFVGHDYGAMFGAINSGLDKRVKAYVLMAGLGNFSDWSLKYWPATAKTGADAYRQKVSQVDPIRFVDGAAPAALLFQFSNKDKYITRDAAEQFFQAASEPKAIKWYDTDHQLGSDAVTRDRVAWLTEQLGLTPVVASRP